jgi:hypothetical protein
MGGQHEGGSDWPLRGSRATHSLCISGCRLGRGWAAGLDFALRCASRMLKAAQHASAWHVLLLASTPGLAAFSHAGQGALSDHLLLVPDDSSSSAAQSPIRVGSGRISGAGAGAAASGRQSGPGSLRPSSAGGGGSRRPSSAAKRGSSGSAVDQLVIEDMQRMGIGGCRAQSLPTPGDNDF